jgi:hypothetical protein
LPITTKTKATITNMKFYQQINKYMEEADIERLAEQDSREEYEDELDKKEAYKQYLYNKDEPDKNAEQLSLKIEDLMDDLSIADPDAFERLVIFANDLLKFRRGVSL